MSRTIKLENQNYDLIPKEIQMHDPQIGKSYQFHQSAIHIGTESDNDIVVHGNPHVSKTHARLIKDQRGRWTVEDLQSTNGIHLNHQPVVKAYLQQGDMISLAGYHFVFTPKTLASTQSHIDQLITQLGIAVQSPAMKQTYQHAYQFAQTQENICIFGETGTGKDILANFIHHARFHPKERTYIAINMTAIPENLIEFELFGAKKGSFTGAIKDTKGLFESAGQGTVFLDEIGDLSLTLQPKLLRILENKEVRRIGESTSRKLSCSCIFATHQNLKEKVSQGEFREDLYHRMCVLPLTLPPLRERQEEIIPLTKLFLSPTFQLDEAAEKKVLTHDYPGNIRELKNLITRARILAQSSQRHIITPDDIIFL